MPASELTAFGDKELHVAKSWLPPKNEEWHIPVFVQYYRSDDQEYARIAPAVGLNASQARYLAAHFSLNNKWKREDVFLILRKDLELLTYRAPGVTPAYYFRWPGQEAPIDERKRLRVDEEDISKTIPDDAEDFFGYVHRRCHVDIAVLRLVWSAMVAQAPGWLINKKRHINLGFVKIYALPYRANWKEILLARFPNAYWWMKYKNKPGFESLDNENVRAQMSSLEMMAIHGTERYLYWTLEAVPTEEFEIAAREIEKIKKAGGPTKYVNLHEETLASVSANILAVFTNYLEKVARSFPKLVAGVLPGSKKLVSYTGPRKVLPQIGQNIPCRIVVNNGPAQIQDSDPKLLVRPKAIKVSQVSPAVQADHAVREPILEAELVEPKNTEDGTSRLPVQYGDESQPAWEPVLPKSAGDSGGLDTGAD